MMEWSEGTVFSPHEAADDVPPFLYLRARPE